MKKLLVLGVLLVGVVSLSACDFGKEEAVLVPVEISDIEEEIVEQVENEIKIIEEAEKLESAEENVSEDVIVGEDIPVEDISANRIETDFFVIENTKNLYVEKREFGVFTSRIMGYLQNSYCFGDKENPELLETNLEKYFDQNDFAVEYIIQLRQDLEIRKDQIVDSKSIEDVESLKDGIINVEDVDWVNSPKQRITVIPNKFGISTKEELSELIGSLCAAGSLFNLYKITPEVIIFTSSCGSGGGTNLVLKDAKMIVYDRGDLDICSNSLNFFKDNINIEN